MNVRLVNIDRNTPMMFPPPPDLRDWVPGNDIVLFIIDAVELIDLKDWEDKKGKGKRRGRKPQGHLKVQLKISSIILLILIVP